MSYSCLNNYECAVCPNEIECGRRKEKKISHPMTDIVERLEAHMRVFGKGGVCEEAAAEITRLRAALAEEREACAKVADESADLYYFDEGGCHVVAEKVAREIRARAPQPLTPTRLK